MGKKTEKNQRIRKEAERFCGEKVRPFEGITDLYNASRILFGLRVHLGKSSEKVSCKDTLSLERRVSRRFHEIIYSSGPTCIIIKKLQEYDLNEMEKEIALLLAFSSLGMLPDGIESVDSVKNIQNALNMKGEEGLAVLSALLENSTLVRSGLVEVDESSIPIEADVRISRDFAKSLIPGAESSGRQAPVEKYSEFLDSIHGIAMHFRKRAEEIRDRYNGVYDIVNEVNQRVEKGMASLMKTLGRNSGWPLARLLGALKKEEERHIIIILAAKEMGFPPGDIELYTAEGLARAVSRDIQEVRPNLELLKEGKPLQKKKLIQVHNSIRKGTEKLDEGNYSMHEFELTTKCLKRLRIKKRGRESTLARPPGVKMEQLVFSKEVEVSLELALAQARHHDILMDKWGLADVISYGRGITVLFSGPPGVGKTAAAEAMTHELGKNIIVANYAEVQNIWYGRTEKNIVRMFREAFDTDAVLFWDEADAMFFDRKNGIYPHEIRNVNVLLHEVERFEGLCILSTNLKVRLDSALERRITIKVDFKAPDRKLSRRIWEKMLSEKLPLESDVDYDRLAAACLTGGEIKNVLLNAARLAICRGPKEKITMADFNTAIEMEKRGKWTSSGKVGFRPE